MRFQMILHFCQIYSPPGCPGGQWRCQHQEECIPEEKRCDGIVGDCLDLSDEEFCSCGDLQEVGLKCDGVPDCGDHSDESGCNVCDNNQWLCPLSAENGGQPVCVPQQDRCNVEVTCPWGEDERHCVALARRGELLIADDGTPIDNTAGTLCVFDDGRWSPVCTQAFATKTMHTLCRYMGWPRGVYNQLVKKDQATELKVVEEVGLKKGRSLREEEEGQCSHVSLACDPSACGRRPLYMGIDQIPNYAVAAWPWSANLFVEDEQVCGATLVHAKFILTELECATKVINAMSSGKFVVVLVGQERRTRVGLSPWAQVRRVVSLKKLLNSGVVLGQLESVVNLGERVSPLCLPPLDFDLRPSTKCVLTGPNQQRWTTALEVERIQCKQDNFQGFDVCIKAASAGVDTKGWAGALACPDSSGRWMAVAAYYSAGSSPPEVMTSLLGIAMREDTIQIIRRGLAMPRYPPPDQCAKRRCVLGRCLEEERMCDRVWDCQDGEDELGCDYIKVDRPNPNVTVTCQPERSPGGASPSRCICPPGFGKCRSKDICLPMNLFCNGEDNCGDGSDEDEDCANCVGKIKFFTPQLLCDGESIKHSACEEVL